MENTIKPTNYTIIKKFHRKQWDKFKSLRNKEWVEYLFSESNPMLIQSMIKGELTKQYRVCVDLVASLPRFTEKGYITEEEAKMLAGDYNLLISKLKKYI